jgi:co-chaperonin GroES (HSP10)
MTLAIENLKLLSDKILVKNMEFGSRKTASGIIQLDDEMTVAGARPRMCQVLAVGPDVLDVNPGQYITVDHGRWTRGWEMLENNEKIIVRMIDNNDILFVTDEPSEEYKLSEKL